MVEAYCVRCKTKREIKDPIADFNKNGTPVTTGTCSVCGTKVYRIGKTPQHEGMVSPGKMQKPRSGKLVIVESPAKAKTVGRFLGKGYTCAPQWVMFVTCCVLKYHGCRQQLHPKYRVPNEKRAVVKELKGPGQRSSQIYLATDPDREGEELPGICLSLLRSTGTDPAGGFS